MLASGLGLMTYIFVTLYFEIKNSVAFEYRKNKNQYIIFFSLFFTVLVIDLV